MSDKLVICSSPVDDNLIGEKYNADYCNILEYNWEDVFEKTKTYNDIILEHNGQLDIEAIRLKTFANLYNFSFNHNVKFNFYANTITNKKILDNQILIIGCSHTAGAGHSSQSTVYTKILADKMDKDLIVDGHKGRGNWLVEEKLQTYDLSNSFVVLQFTDIFRIRLNGENIKGHEMSKSQSQVFNDEVLASIFLEQVKRIVNLLRANNAKFCFFHISHGYSLHTEVENILSLYKEYVYLSNFNLDTGDLGHHCGKISHTYWAEKLYQKFCSLCYIPNHYTLS